MEVGREVNRLTVPTERSERVRPGPNFMGQSGVLAVLSGRSDQRDQVNQLHRQDHSRERRQWGPCGACGAAGHDAHFCRCRCKFCKKVHDTGRCELLAEFERLTKFVKSSIDRTTVPEEFQHINAWSFKLGDSPNLTPSGANGLPQSVEPAVDANYVFAFVGDTRRPGDEEYGKEDIVEDQLKLSITDEQVDGERAMDRMDASRDSRRPMESEKPLKLLQRDRLGWWSSRKFDGRVRMRAFVMGAVNDERTKILLDTEANISATSESFAPKLELKSHISTDKHIDFQGIGSSKVVTASKITAKVTLGWEVVFSI